MDSKKGNQSNDDDLSRRGLLLVSCLGVVAFIGLALGGYGVLSQKPRSIINNPRFFDDDLREPFLTDDELLNLQINKIIREMSLEHKVSQLFIVRPESVGGADATTQTGEQVREYLKKRPVGGLVYFAQNLINAEQTTVMLANALRYGLESNGIPPFLCVDEEGGSVSRIGGNYGFDAVNVGDMANVGARNDPNIASDIASYIAEYLKPLGFNVDFAPVCDIANNPYSNTMKQRSFGSDSEQVARMVQAQIGGFLESGMLCCAKHFPGIGSAVGDSHYTKITSYQSIEALHETELVPFKAAIRAGVPFIMVGHVCVPSVTGDNAPASLSYNVVQKLLREELKYEGLIITDSLEMGAVYDYCSDEESSVFALAAGCDIALMPTNLESAISCVLDAINRGEISEERINESLRRILRIKLRL